MSLSLSTRSILVRFRFLPLKHTTTMAASAIRAAPPAAEPAMMLDLLDLAGRFPSGVDVGVGVGAILPEGWADVSGKFSRSISCYCETDKVESTNVLRLPQLGLS